MCASYKGSESYMVYWLSVSSRLVHFVDGIKDLKYIAVFVSEGRRPRTTQELCTAVCAEQIAKIPLGF